MENKLANALSEKLSPKEIKTKEFKKVVLGYAPNEVVDFLAQTARAWEAVQKKEKELLDKIQSLQAEIAMWKEKEKEIILLKESVLEEADKIKRDAEIQAQKMFNQVEDKANGIRTRTEAWLAEVINQVQETERQKSNFMKAFRSALDSHYELIKNDQELAEPLSHQLDNFLKSVNEGVASH